MDRQRIKINLIRREGKRFKPYPCPAGHMTIGVGWNMDANPLPPGIASYLKSHGYITEQHVDTLLSIAIDRAARECEVLFPAFCSFSDIRQEALVDLVFNMGKFKLSHKFPAFCHNVNIGYWQGAADELKYADGEKKGKLSDYWVQLHGDPDGTDDGKLARPEEIYRELVEG